MFTYRVTFQINAKGETETIEVKETSSLMAWTKAVEIHPNGVVINVVKE